MKFFEIFESRECLEFKIAFYIFSNPLYRLLQVSVRMQTFFMIYWEAQII